MSTPAAAPALRYLASLGRAGMRFDLGRARAVLNALGNPQNSFLSIHIAGTNGKGSTAAMIERILREAGHRTALYTSPHLERINERFQLNGRMITDAELAACVARLRAALRVTKIQMTQFEALTVIAFLWFSTQRPGIAVIETGLGGRLDATNVLDQVAVSVITNIGLDHTDWLGSTVEKIAAEKAGIIKRGVPVVTGAVGSALAEIRRTAAALHSPLLVVTPGAEKGLHPGLEGRHQIQNARVAAAAVRALRWSGLFVQEGAIRRGIRSARWPGRFERFPYRHGRNRMRVVLDGAHNPDGMRSLAAILREKGWAPVDLLFGALKDKDFRTMAGVIAPLAGRCVTVPVPSERSATAEALAALPAWKGRARPARSIDDGWDSLVRSNKGRPIVVAGSLYLVGALRARLAGTMRKGRYL